MDINELIEKADFIADKMACRLKQWQQYCNILTQGITLSKVKLYQTICCNPDDGVCFFLFNQFKIHIRLADSFNSRTIEYVLKGPFDGDSVLIASAAIDDRGRIGNIIDICNREQVLEHYLGLLRPVYDGLYEAVKENTPLSMSLFQQTDMD